jgi:hypothetical protein
VSSITEPIEQPGTDASVASNSASVPRNEVPSVPALRVVSYEALIWVMPPPKKSSTRRKKVMKTDPVTYGPADFASDSIWDQFLTQLASTVDSLASLLALPSLEWRWQKPANSLWVPLRGESGYASFLRKLRDARGSPCVIFRMDAPSTPLPTLPATTAQTVSYFLILGF